MAAYIAYNVTRTLPTARLPHYRDVYATQPNEQKKMFIFASFKQEVRYEYKKYYIKKICHNIYCFNSSFNVFFNQLLD